MAFDNCLKSLTFNRCSQVVLGSVVMLPVMNEEFLGPEVERAGRPLMPVSGGVRHARYGVPRNAIKPLTFAVDRNEMEKYLALNSPRLPLALFKTMRPQQWTKNAFVFVAVVFDRQLLHPLSLGQTLAAFVLLCVMSSAVYIMNDLADMESDRAHPTKRNRPLPAGHLSPRAAQAAALLLALGSLMFGFSLSLGLGWILLAYLVVQVAYTFWLKRVVILDVSMVAFGFVLRIGAGVVVIEVARFSPWLYVFGGFLALFLALGKRRHELLLLGQEAGNHRAILEEYNLALIDRLLGIVTTSVIVAYSLYTFLAEGMPPNHVMMLTIPFVLYGVFRYLYLIHVRGEGGAPDEILLRDRPLGVTLLLWAAVVFLALYVL
jgi:4-hydroxybenzoate polyprenyltransferase